MQLYSGSTSQFVRDNVQNQVADKLKDAFFGHYRFQPPPSEVRSWQNSLKAMSLVISEAQLTDHGVLLEYQLPQTSKRIDCILTGRDKEGSDRAVIVELKQWEACVVADGEYVVTWIGHANRETLHPSAQSAQYRYYLANTHTAFHEENPVLLDSCSYLHNYGLDARDALLDLKYRRFIAESPLFSKNDVDGLEGFLRSRLDAGRGMDVLARVQQSKYRPSQKLMDEVRKMIKGKSEYVLLDDQLVAYDKVHTLVRKGLNPARKQVVIIKGGPGTGKSVIAMNLLGDLLKENFSAHYATGSRAFTETLRKAIGRGSGPLFKYFNSFREASRNEIDVLIADEAHRIRELSLERFMKKADYPKRPQIHELIDVAKVSAFFIDDDQSVRPNEIGSSDYIRRAATEFGADVHVYELQVQFRCMGSDAFVNWISNTLGIKRTANILWEGKESFDFQIKESPEELEQAIRDKVAQGFSGRLAAGYCWHWSMPNSDGTLPDDVVIRDYKRPWDARPEAKKLAPGIPPATLWAFDPSGINQIGCVYNAQGFEFDYVGVIFGPDLRYDPIKGDWAGHPEESHDATVKRGKDGFLRHVKNVYRVLLSRGIRGCYVHFMDPDTRNFFRSRVSA